MVKQVKRGFEYEGSFYKPGVKVSDFLAQQFPEHVKDAPVAAKEKVVKVAKVVVEEKVVQNEEPVIVKAPSESKKSSKKKAKK